MGFNSGFKGLNVSAFQFNCFLLHREVILLLGLYYHPLLDSSFKLEPTITEGERSQTHALDRSATGTARPCKK